MRLLLAACALLVAGTASAQELPQTPAKGFFSEKQLQLLEGTAPINAEDIYPQDPAQKLRHAFDCGGLEGLNSYLSELYGRDELHYAAVHGDILRVKQLILEKADLNQKDNMGKTPLMLAAGNGRMEVVKALLAAGADPLLQDYSGYTAFDTAVVDMWTEIADVLRPYNKKAEPTKP